MAQYKVPQNVEADDKLLGPFTFRQFVYLLIAGGLIALAVGLFQLFPFLAIIPVPFILFFAALALPLKKDQPMETYLAALVSYYLKPHIRLWEPGQRDSVIKITAPKVKEESRTRNISGEEANHRLSFLADVVDSEGYAIKGINDSPMREDLMAEASTAVDMFEGHKFNTLNNTIQKDEAERHAEVVNEMKEAINASTAIGNTIRGSSGYTSVNTPDQPDMIASTLAVEDSPIVDSEVQQSDSVAQSAPWDVSAGRYNSAVVVAPNLGMADNNAKDKAEKKSEKMAAGARKSSIIRLANNSDYSIETIAKEAKRINEREGEVFISLH